jgi:hypothetical protein
MKNIEKTIPSNAAKEGSTGRAAQLDGSVK